MGYNGAKHHSAYGRQESRRWSDATDSSGNSWSMVSLAKDASKSSRLGELPAVAETPALADLESMLSNAQKDFAQQMQTFHEKGAQKFDLIFAILTDLQAGQAHLEESIQEIQKIVGNGQASCVPPMMPLPDQQHDDGQQPSQHFNGNDDASLQQFGHMDSAMMGGQMGAQQPMQQVVVQPDGSQATMVMMPVAMPASSVGVMMMPQTMPAGGQMQPVQAQMAMQPVQPMMHQPEQTQDVTGGFPTMQAAVLGTDRDAEDKAAQRLAGAGKVGSDSDLPNTPTTATSILG